jgi:predicted small secreted protein
MPRPAQARALRLSEADDARLRRLAAALSMLSVLALGSTLLAGCNTVGGAGEDLQAAGRAVTGTAEEVKRTAP